MTQAKGALSQLLFQRGVTPLLAPVAPDAVLLPFTSYNVFRDPKKSKDPSVSASPLPAKSGCGDATVEGPIKSILDLRTIGYWLSLILGVPTAHKAVTKQPTNVTGVTVHYAQATAGAGNGTLTYANTGKTLTWADQGGTAGTPVNVTAGGRFTIPASVGNHGIVVEVAASALPSTDKTDADIAVSTTLKAHVFPFNTSERLTALLELGHLDIAKFKRVNWAFLSKLSFDVLASEQSIDLAVICGAETIETAAWDATPTSYAGVRACGHGGFLGNGSTAGLGVITGGTLGLDLGAKGMKIANQTEGYGMIDWGEVALSGTLQVVFDGAGAWSTARADGSTRLRVGSAAPVGADVFGLYWDLPNVELTEKSKAIEGKSGLFVDLEWMAHRDTAGNLPMVTLINDVVTY